MNKLTKWIILSSSIVFFFLQGCVDKDYDTDKLNKTVAFNVPPIFFPDVDTIFIKGLPSIVPPDYVGVRMTVAYSDTIRGLFDKDVTSKIFYEGSAGIEFKSKIDVYFESPANDFDLNIYLYIINQDGKRNTSVVIPKQSLTVGRGQDFSIKISPEYAKFMADARDIEVVVKINASSIAIANGDYLYIRNTVITTGGIQFEL